MMPLCEVDFFFHHRMSHGQSTTWRSPSFSRSNMWLFSSSWNPSTHLAFFFELWRYPPSDAVLTTAISPITGRLVEGGSVLFFPVQVHRTCLLPMEQGKATTVQDRSGKCFTEEQDILNRWTEYCAELFNYKVNGDPSVLDCTQTDTEDDHPILRKEVQAAVQPLRKGRSAGVDNIPAELVQAGGEDVITGLTTICNKFRQTGEWPTPWTQTLVITLPKKGNLQQCPNYRTISLISHPSKGMLKIILNRLKPQAEKIIAEEQAGFRAGRSPQSRFSTFKSSVRNISSTSKTSTMSS